MIAQDSIVRPSKDQAWCDLGEEAAILGLRSGVYYGLEQAGAFIWRHLQNGVTVEGLYEALLEEYEVPPQTGRSDLMRLLKDLHRYGLIEIREKAG